MAAGRSALLYGPETWPLRVEDMRKTLVFEHIVVFVVLAEYGRKNLSATQVLKIGYNATEFILCK